MKRKDVEIRKSDSKYISSPLVIYPLWWRPSLFPRGDQRDLGYFFLKVKSETYKKTVDGMVLKMLWEKVYAGYDPKVKETAIKQLRQSGDYDQLIGHLLKAKKEKVQKIINLVGEVIIAYMR